MPYLRKISQRKPEFGEIKLL